MTTAKKALEAAVTRTVSKPAEEITDPFAQAIARRLEYRGIVKVPGLRPPKAEEPTAVDNAIEWHRRSAELQAEWDAARKAQEELAVAPKTPAGMLFAEIGREAEHVALNGVGVLHAARSGMGAGTINGQP